MDTKALASILGRAAFAVAAAMPVPAAAQAGPTATVVSAYSSSKTEAILGGGSRLAAILAQQSGQPVAQSTLTAASYGVANYRSVMPAYRPAVASDRPDVFHSVALPVSRTPFDRRWRRVALASATPASATYATRLQSMSEIARMDAVNRYVNSRVTFVDDIRQFGIADRWTAAAETLRRGKGDCEDYAIAKLQLLRRAGFADENLYLVILRDQTRRSDHAVLAVRSGGRLWVLDNGTDRIVDSDDINDYRPIMSFSAGKAWIHGYRRVPPPVVVAEVAPSPVITFAASAITPVAPSPY